MAELQCKLNSQPNRVFSVKVNTSWEGMGSWKLQWGHETRNIESLNSPRSSLPAESAIWPLLKVSLSFPEEVFLQGTADSPQNLSPSLFLDLALDVSPSRLQMVSYKVWPTYQKMHYTPKDLHNFFRLSDIIWVIWWKWILMVWDHGRKNIKLD